MFFLESVCIQKCTAECLQVRNNFLSISASVAALIVFSLSAEASPSCLKEKEPFALSSDTVKWTMTIAPGAERIQGLRWSYMQIYEVSVISGPSNGRLVMVGSGFRYYADQNNQSEDKFTLLISGKNKRDVGQSTLEVEVLSGSGEANGEKKRIASTQAIAESPLEY
jgi:hypothetical protein